MRYIANAFSLNMLSRFPATIYVDEIGPEHVPADVQSAIGHPDLAAVVSSLLARDVPVNRVTLSLKPGDVLFVAQYRGPRLAPGTTRLPPDAEIRFYQVSIWEG